MSINRDMGMCGGRWRTTLQAALALVLCVALV